MSSRSVYVRQRARLFVQLERPVAEAVAGQAVSVGGMATRRVNIDYHIEVEGYYFGVPYALVHQQSECI